jgi:LysR family transcriptional regulator, transcriptional activator of nhaA
MGLTFSYRHLYYFWVVAKEGSMSAAAARLDMAVQTISAQVRGLERALGHALLKPAGRGLVLTDAGVAAMNQADQIFQLGERLPELLRETAGASGLRLAVGISDGMPKLVVRRLLQPVLAEPQLRLLCHEDDFDGLLADLALHRIDVVLADRAAPAHPNLKVYSHALGSSAMSWYAPPALLARLSAGFPHSLAQLPVLLPTPQVAVRHRIDHWFERLGLRPRVAGEFEDSALLVTFGAAGMGVFAAPDLIHDKLSARYGVQRVGPCDGVEEHFFAIGTERRIQHPLAQRLLPPRAAVHRGSA